MSKILVGVDRDNTLIKDPYGYFPYGIENWREKIEFCEGVLDGLKLLQGKNVFIAVISNQAGVARGYFELETVEEVNRLINEQLEENGIKPLPFFYCPYVDKEYAQRNGIPLDSPYVDDEKAKRRKPNKFMLEEAAEYYGFKLHELRIFTIGDKDTDVYTGLYAGGIGILVGPYKKGLDLRNVLFADNFYKASILITSGLQ
ncbi:MAG: HAD-IIIA family hydrolase [Candidatus Aenigmatarchaeota archaeon]|nr:HAD-IIIA family hydrolase [Candidatus Aenigmarchaeota archaeon]